MEHWQEEGCLYQGAFDDGMQNVRDAEESEYIKCKVNAVGAWKRTSLRE